MSRAALNLVHGELPLPAFLPDATLGVVRTVDAADLARAGTRGLVMNVFHLMQKPGSSTIAALGGLHAMSGWGSPIITDSGGFQAYSLIRQNRKFGSLSDRGLSFQPEGADRKFLLSPEKCVSLQMAYGSDVVMCLDDCTHAEEAEGEQKLAVARTIRWAARCKEEFTRQIERRKMEPAARPRLFAVVQGGSKPDLRRACAEALLALGFDGYGFGGWPFSSQGALLAEILAYCRELIPDRFPMHALGVGHPDHIVTCAAMGYQIFDSALPTRDARGGRLHVFTSDPGVPGFQVRGAWHDTLYIQDKKHIKTATPISPSCDCHTCATYSVGYLHHLHACNEALYARLATIHNLRFMSTLMALLQDDDRAVRG